MPKDSWDENSLGFTGREQLTQTRVGAVTAGRVTAVSGTCPKGYCVFYLGVFHMKSIKYSKVLKEQEHTPPLFFCLFFLG